MNTIRRASIQDASIVGSLACQLWPENPLEEMEDEFALLLTKEDAAIFLAEREGEAIGFAQCQLRRDYVEGSVSSRVGYLVGFFVEVSGRRRGLARELLSACESWARDRGCKEFASDCELTNTQSLQFHLALGFEEANRIICFTKKL